MAKRTASKTASSKTAPSKTKASKAVSSKASSSKISSAAVDIPSFEPLPRAGEVIAHEGVSLLELADPADLSAIMVHKKIAPHVLARLSETEALVLPDSRDALLKALKQAGYTPKVL
ncbi:MAG: hypothetical protein AAF267_11030 [Deinococcota bacterium]